MDVVRRELMQRIKILLFLMRVKDDGGVQDNHVERLKVSESNTAARSLFLPVLQR